MEKRLDRKPSRTAEWICVARAASSLECDPYYRSDDHIAPRILPPPIKYLIRSPFYRKLHFGVGAPYGIYEYVIARTKYIDTVCRRAIDDGFGQVVILGAGYDTRALRLFHVASDMKVFEIDSGFTQRAKLAVYESKNIVLPGNLTFVAVDFGSDDLARVLCANGFAPRLRSLFVLDGVSMYLDGRSIDILFRAVSGLMEKKSLIVFDHMIRRPDTGGRTRGESIMRRSTSRVGEELRFALDDGDVRTFLASYGLSLIDHLDPERIRTAFFTTPEGKRVGDIDGMHCLVLAEKA
jgi:methyltransferase (TIGR00027 family)